MGFLRNGIIFFFLLFIFLILQITLPNRFVLFFLFILFYFIFFIFLFFFGSTPLVLYIPWIFIVKETAGEG